jgi:hypothetical protein
MSRSPSEFSYFRYTQVLAAGKAAEEFFAAFMPRIIV